MERIQVWIAEPNNFPIPNNQVSTAANVYLGLDAKNTTKIITAVEQLNDLMNVKIEYCI